MWRPHAPNAVVLARSPAPRHGTEEGGPRHRPDSRGRLTLTPMGRPSAQGAPHRRTESAVVVRAGQVAHPFRDAGNCATAPTDPQPPKDPQSPTVRIARSTSELPRPANYFARGRSRNPPLLDHSLDSRCSSRLPAAPCPTSSASPSSRGRRRLTPVVHPAQQLAVGDAGRHEEDVLAPDQVVGGAGPGRGRARRRRARCRSSSSLGHSSPWIAPPMHFTAQAAMTPSGVPPMPSSRSMPAPRRARGQDRAGHVAVGDQLDAGAGLPDLLDDARRGAAGRG